MRSFVRQSSHVQSLDTGTYTTGKGVLSEHEHFPSGASGQSSLEYKCAYLCLYIRKSSLDYDSIKIFIKISCIWPAHMEIVIKVVQCLGG